MNDSIEPVGRVGRVINCHGRRLPGQHVKPRRIKANITPGAKRYGTNALVFTAAMTFRKRRTARGLTPPKNPIDRTKKIFINLPSNTSLRILDRAVESYCLDIAI
jgi:hypothetical protein